MLLTTLAFAQGIANVMNNLNYQIVGIMVVMMCLGGLAVILTISGSIAASIQNKAKAKAAAASAAPGQTIWIRAASTLVPAAIRGQFTLSIAADADLDAIPDPADNCPSVANFDQVDANGGGIGDASKGGARGYAGA